MYLVFEFLIIMSYLINDYLGFAVSGLTFLSIIVYKKESIYNVFLNIMILSLPLYSLSIIGDKINHAFSWLLILLFILSIYNVVTIIKEKIEIEINNILGFLLFVLLLLISNVRFNIYDSFVEIGQVLMMVVPIVTTYICRNSIVKKVKLDDLIVKISDVITATAVCTIIQYVLYSLFHIKIGKITIFPNRLIFDLFFKAYSVLSLFIGIGIVIAVVQFILSLKNKKKEYTQLIRIVVYVIAIVINSSRTGIITALISSFIALNSKTINISSKKKKLLNLFVVLFAIFSIGLISLTRKDMRSFFSDNERSETYSYGLNLIIKNPVSFLFGNGLSSNNYDHMMPHNFVLETLTTSGVLITIMVIIAFVKYLAYIRNSNYKFIVYAILIGSMFITCFYGNPFTTVFMILAVLDEQMKEVKV